MGLLSTQERPIPSHIMRIWGTGSITQALSTDMARVLGESIEGTQMGRRWTFVGTVLTLLSLSGHLERNAFAGSTVHGGGRPCSRCHCAGTEALAGQLPRYLLRRASGTPTSSSSLIKMTGASQTSGSMRRSTAPFCGRRRLGPVKCGNGSLCVWTPPCPRLSSSVSTAWWSSPGGHVVSDGRAVAQRRRRTIDHNGLVESVRRAGQA